MSRIVALPKCFTPEILAGIWDEVLPKGYPDVIRASIYMMVERGLAA